MGSDSQSVLMSSNVLTEEQGLVTFHLRSNLELDSTSQWLSWISISMSVNSPCLVLAIVALVPVNVSLVLVMTSMDI